MVGWPVQPESGKFGAQCGRVLYTLEAILARSNKEGIINSKSRILSPHRPFCLWNVNPVTDQATVGDIWGRCASYGKPTCSSKTLHLASLEQYSFDESMEATDLWQDFWKTHWPNQYKRSRGFDDAGVASQPCSNNLVSDWRDSAAVIAARAAAL